MQEVDAARSKDVLRLKNRASTQRRSKMGCSAVHALQPLCKHSYTHGQKILAYSKEENFFSAGKFNLH
jgi:hypothetical protein